MKYTNVPYWRKYKYKQLTYRLSVIYNNFSRHWSHSILYNSFGPVPTINPTNVSIRLHIPIVKLKKRGFFNFIPLFCTLSKAPCCLIFSVDIHVYSHFFSPIQTLTIFLVTIVQFKFSWPWKNRFGNE